MPRLAEVACFLALFAFVARGEDESAFRRQLFFGSSRKARLKAASRRSERKTERRVEGRVEERKEERRESRGSSSSRDEVDESSESSYVSEPSEVEAAYAAAASSKKKIAASRRSERKTKRRMDARIEGRKQERIDDRMSSSYHEFGSSAESGAMAEAGAAGPAATLPLPFTFPVPGTMVRLSGVRAEVAGLKGAVAVVNEEDFVVEVPRWLGFIRVECVVGLFFYTSHAHPWGAFVTRRLPSGASRRRPRAEARQNRHAPVLPPRGRHSAAER